MTTQDRGFLMWLVGYLRDESKDKEAEMLCEIIIRLEEEHQ